MTDKVFTKKEASEILGITYPTIYSYIKKGKVREVIVPNRRCPLILIEPANDKNMD